MCILNMSCNGNSCFQVIAYMTDAYEHRRGTGLGKQCLGGGRGLFLSFIVCVESAKVSVEKKSPASGV